MVACPSQEQAEQVKAELAEWLAARGLALNEDKTSIVHADRGFDFLEFNIRRYPNGKLLIKPSKAAIKRIRKRLREVFRKMRGEPSPPRPSGALSGPRTSPPANDATCPMTRKKRSGRSPPSRCCV
ncbi:hypothetical protein ACTXG6_33075 [Pseudonocardia sp. Cha107L01]|uniref:hypothetical protein n=1 Tax=Pseudonocardia sp. Cha107L01 TaxID=3457576 RepID=UPI00403EC160